MFHLAHKLRAKIQKNIYICKLFLHIARKWIGFVQKGIKKTNHQGLLDSSFRESTSNREADGSATLEGFLEPFVETLVGLGRLGDETRKGKLANDDLAVDA